MRRTCVRIAIFGCVLSTLLCAAELQATSREAHPRAVCANNLKQIGLGILNYESYHGFLPPPYLANDQGRPIHSWRVLILPFVEEQA
jgi:hypothetical protein